MGRYLIAFLGYGALRRRGQINFPKIIDGKVPGKLVALSVSLDTMTIT